MTITTTVDQESQYGFQGSSIDSNFAEDDKVLTNSSNETPGTFYSSFEDSGRGRSRSFTRSLSMFGRHKNVVTCPTCNGLGRVPKEREPELVALIPMSDGRLKPRRTFVYVLAAIGVCIIAAGLLVFFLIPRDIVITSNSPYLEPDSVDINTTTQFANFTVRNHYNVSNQNFYPVTVTGVYMKAQYGLQVIAETQLDNVSVEISRRSNSDLAIPITFTLQGDLRCLVDHCINPIKWIHNLPIQFEVDITYSYMDHSEQQTLDTFQTVSCYPDPALLSTTTESIIL